MNYLSAILKLSITSTHVNAAMSIDDSFGNLRVLTINSRLPLFAQVEVMSFGGRGLRILDIKRVTF